jgi:Flp pilus assembly protein TadB
VLSGLFLANQVLYSPESLQFQIGQLLAFIVSPFLLILGITMCLVAKIHAPKTTPSPTVINYLADQTNLSTELSNSNSSLQSQSTSPDHSSKTDKPKSDMPIWERWARRIYIIGVLMTSLIIALVQSIVFLPVSALFITLWILPVVMGFYLLKGRHGRVGTWLLLILALLSFVDLLPIPLSLLMGPAGIQLRNYYTAGVIGLDPFGQVSMILALRSGIVLSAGIFLVVARLRQHPKVKQLAISRVFKAAAVVIVLLPLLLMPFIQAGEPTANSHLNPTSGGFSSSSSPSTLTWDSIFEKTYRTFNSTTGLWTYTIAMSNRGETAMILHVWAGFETISPLGTRITIVDGLGVSVSDAGIVFQRGANGTIRFSTAQGHNTVTLDLGSNARGALEW